MQRADCLFRPHACPMLAALVGHVGRHSLLARLRPEPVRPASIPHTLSHHRTNRQSWAKRPSLRTAWLPHVSRSKKHGLGKPH